MTRATTWRKERGAKSQALVAEWYQRLWPEAESAPAGTSGRDVRRVPVDIEVKARTVFDPFTWVKQGRKRPAQEGDCLPNHVVFRPDRLGDKSVQNWLVIRTLEDDTAILEELLLLRNQAAAVKTVGDYLDGKHAP